MGFASRWRTSNIPGQPFLTCTLLPPCERGDADATAARHVRSRRERADPCLASCAYGEHMPSTRTIIIDGDLDPLPVVFEMRGPTIEVRPGERLRLVVSGPEDAELTIGIGRNGISVYRDLALKVDVYGPDGAPVEMDGFA